MDSLSKIKVLRDDIRELERIREQLLKYEEKVIRIEKAVCAIDESLPSDEEISAMPEGELKRENLQIVELAGKAFELVDEILGSPDQNEEACPDVDEASLSPEAAEHEFSFTDGLALNGLTPEARGNDSVSLEYAIRRFRSGGKNTVS